MKKQFTPVKKFISCLLSVMLLLSVMTTGTTVFASQTDNEPVGAGTLKVTAASNVFAQSSQVYDASEGTVTVSYKLQSNFRLINGQWSLYYDSTKLRFDEAKNVDEDDFSTAMPNIADAIVNAKEGKINGNFTSLKLYNFTTEKDFVSVVFDVVGTGETTVNLELQILGIAYKDGSMIYEAYPVDNSKIQDVTGKTGFSDFTYSTASSLSEPVVAPATEPTTAQLTTAQPTTAKPTVAPTTAKPTVQPTTAKPASDTLTVKATSNFFEETSQTYDVNEGTVTVTYKLQSNFRLINGQWSLYYDSTKLRFDEAKNVDEDDFSTAMPNIADAIVNAKEGKINGNFTSLKLYNFTIEKDFISVVFDIVGTGETTVNLDMQILGVAYKDGTNLVEAYPVDDSKVQNITGQSGFESFTSKATSALSEPKTQPVTQPTTAKPTVAPTTAKPTVQPTTAQPTTKPSTDKLTINVTSNLFPAQTVTTEGKGEAVTIAYKLQSNMKLINAEWQMTYDSTKLTYDTDINDDDNLMPAVAASSIINPYLENRIRGNFTTIKLADFTTEKDFVVVTFLASGTGSTTVDLNVEILSIAYKDGDKVIDTCYVDNSSVLDVTKISGFENADVKTKTVVSGVVEPTEPQPTTAKPTVAPTTAQPTTVKPTEPLTPVKDFTVHATSNYFPEQTMHFDNDTNEITIKYKFTSEKKILNVQTEFFYDSSILKLSSKNFADEESDDVPMFPIFDDAVCNTKYDGEIYFNASKLKGYNFTTEGDFLVVVFDVVGKLPAETTVNLWVEILTATETIDGHYYDTSLVDDGIVYDVPFATSTGVEVKDTTERTKILYGDVDLDGKISVSDVTMLQRYISKDNTLDATQLEAADVNHDGMVNVYDVTMIQRHIAKQLVIV